MLILDDLIIDTGSSNTWVGGNKPYKETTTSVKTSDMVVRIVSRADSQPCSIESERNIWIRFYDRLVIPRESRLPYLHLQPGAEYLDSVTIAPGVVISGQSIGVASNSSGFFNLDGIMG